MVQIVRLKLDSIFFQLYTKFQLLISYVKVQKYSQSCECTFQIRATVHVCGSNIPSNNAAFTEWEEKLQVIFWHDKLGHSLINSIQVKHIRIAETFL